MSITDPPPPMTPDETASALEDVLSTCATAIIGHHDGWVHDAHLQRSHEWRSDGVPVASVAAVADVELPEPDMRLRIIVEAVTP